MAKYTNPEGYIASQDKFLELLVSLDNIISDCGLVSEIKWGTPCYMHKGKNVVGLAAFKEYVAIWFFQGGLLEDKAKVLVNANEGVTKALRQWRFKTLEEIDRNLIQQYIHESIANFDEGRTIKPSKEKKEIIVPKEIQDAIKKDKSLKAAFGALSNSNQREYCEYIAEAKKEATRMRRLEKIIPMIIDHKGLHDKYNK